jgi:hypothetical protein
MRLKTHTLRQRSISMDINGKVWEIAVIAVRIYAENLNYSSGESIRFS